MSQSAPTVSLAATLVRKLAHLGRFIIFLCSSGWLYPHVCTEGMDLTRIQNGHMARKD